MKKQDNHSEIPAISDSEWEIMNVLWDRGESRARDILERIPAEKNWKRKTINTFLTRLVTKCAVGVRKDGHINLYRWIISRDECVRGQSSSFLKRVFRGATAPMLMHFLKHEKLTAEDISALETVLKSNQKS